MITAAILLSAFALTLLLIYLLIPISPKLGLLDHPVGRKAHANATPLVGGLAMAITLVLSMVYTQPAYAPGLLLAVLVLTSVGVADDIHELSPLPKFILQAAACLAMYYLAGVQLRGVGNLIGTGPIGVWFLGPVMTVFAVVGVINAINMADGIDGHAGSIGLIAFVAYAYVAHQSGLWDQYKLLLVLCGAMAGFLLMNLRFPWQPHARTFLGDTGSMLVGLMIAWFAVDLSHGPSRSFSPICALWVVVLPLCDCVSLMIRRKRAGNSMFMADRQHLHHYLLNRRFSVGQATMISAAANAICATIGVVGWKLHVPEPVMFAGFVGLFVGFHLYMGRAFRVTPENSRLASESVAT